LFDKVQIPLYLVQNQVFRVASSRRPLVENLVEKLLWSKIQLGEFDTTAKEACNSWYFSVYDSHNVISTTRTSCGRWDLQATAL